MPTPDIGDLITTNAQGRMTATDPDQLRHRLTRLQAITDPDLTTLRRQGTAHLALGETEQAISVLERAAAAATTPQATAAVYINLADAYRYADRLADAEPLYRNAVTIARADCPHLVHFSLQHLGKHLIDAGQRDRARTALTEALRLRQALGDNDLVESTHQALRLAGHAHDRDATNS